MTIISIFLISILGFSVLNSIKVKDIKGYEKLALGFLIGNSIFTFILFLANKNGIAYTEYNLTIILLFLSTISFLIQNVTKKIYNSKLVNLDIPSQNSNSAIQKYGKLYLGIIFLTVFASSLYSPVKDWDSLVLYDFRAKTFVETGYMFDGISKGYFFGYPLLSSLSHTWAYLFGFSYPTIVHALYFISFILVYGYVLRQINMSKSGVIITQVLIASLPRFFGHAFMTYTNLMYSVYLILSYLFLALWTKSRSKSDLFISALLLTSASWTRINEPFWMSAVILVLIYSVINRKVYLAILYYIPNKLLQNSWFNFEILNSAPRASTESAMGGYLSVIFSNINISQIVLVGSYVYNNVLKIDVYLYLIIALLLASRVLLKNKIYNPKFNNTLYPLFILIFLNVGIVLAGTYVFSLTFSTWDQIGDSASRMSMFITPLLVTVICILIDSILSSKNYDYKK